jgi:sugar phosphate isomerase/epimerase
MLPISIASYSFHASITSGVMDVFGYLEACRYRYHLRTADIWNGLMGKDPAVCLSPEFTTKVRQALLDRELELVNYHADGCHPWENDAAAREKNFDLARRHIEAAERMGAKTVRIDTGGREDYWSDEAFDLIVRRFREWSKRAADHGYRIGPEVHWGAEIVPENMQKLAKAVDSPGFGVLLHIGRWGNTDPDAGDRGIAPYTMHTHVDSATLSTRIASALNILLDAGYQGCLSVEDGSGQNEYNQVEKMIAETKLARQRVLLARAGANSAKQTRENPLIPPGAQKM